MGIDIVSTGDLKCHRCLGVLYLAIRAPHPEWQPSPGTQASFTRLVGLCPKCDADCAAAQSLLAYFAIYSEVTEDTIDTFAELLQRWVNDVGCQQVNPSEVDSEIQQWHNGEFD
jgi:uncharacterized protein DUF6300